MKRISILVLILCTCFASVAWGQQPASKVCTGWSEFHRPDMTRLNPCEKVLNVNNVGSLSLKWSYTTGGDVTSSPAVANGVVYVGSCDDNVYALNASTGAKLWSYTTGGDVYSSPAVANGVVYVGSYDDNVYALNASTGAKLWSYATGDSVDSSPTVANGVVYVGSSATVRAERQHRRPAVELPTPAGDSSPAVANGVVYVGSDDDKVYALNASTGAMLWSYTAARCPRPRWRMGWFISARMTATCTR